MEDKKTTQEEINRVVWKACDTFRGVIDSGQYKDYILTMLFLKYVSDVYKQRRQVYMDKYDGDLERAERAMRHERFVVPETSSFDFLYENRNANNIGELIDEAFAGLEDANREKMSSEDGGSIFRNISFNSAILGEVKEKNARLKNLLADFNGLTLALVCDVGHGVFDNLIRHRAAGMIAFKAIVAPGVALRGGQDGEAVHALGGVQLLDQRPELLNGLVFIKALRHQEVPGDQLVHSRIVRCRPIEKCRFSVVKQHHFRRDHIVEKQAVVHLCPEKELHGAIHRLHGLGAPPQKRNVLFRFFDCLHAYIRLSVLPPVSVQPRRSILPGSPGQSPECASRFSQSLQSPT